ncbi:MAG: hypothetical protein N3D11_00090 [Candidatus Sumerlaeia bacterium]|nr:hypothetical protein [Candidatus Sumerlaeia bacterium]
MSEKQPETRPTRGSDENSATGAPTSGDDLDASPLLLQSETGSLVIPDDADFGLSVVDDTQGQPAVEETEVVMPPAEEQDLGIVRLDDLGDLPLPDIEAGAHPAAREAAPPPPEHEAPPMDVGELTLLLMEDQTAKVETTAREEQATAEPEPSAPLPSVSPLSEPAGGEILDESIPSALLIHAEPEEEADSASSRREAPAGETESEITFGTGYEDLARGRSALLLSGSGAEIESETVHEPPPAARPKRFWRRRRERIKIVVPKPGTPVQWYSNADACAVYCRKHSRPLLLYFTTGDAEQCHTYEAAIRQPEMQPFLCTYVCCMVNLSHAEGRRVAMRLGVPTDGPGIVLLSPSGREYARILKPEVDWHFLATVLFWALR